MLGWLMAFYFISSGSVPVYVIAALLGVGRCAQISK